MRLTKLSPTATISPAKLFAILLALLLLPALAVACGGDDDEGDTGNGGDASESGDDGVGSDDDDMDGDDGGDDAGGDDGGDDAGDDMDDGGDAGDDDAGSNEGDDTAGTITVGDESWTLVPSVQCSFFAGGEVVYIAGYAAEDEAIEIFVDYDTQDDFYNASIEDDGEPLWTAEEQSLEFEVSGNTIRGTGDFRRGFTEDTVEGSFEVTC